MQYQSIKSKQQGASLVLVMLLFVALTIVGLAVMRSGILSQKQANNIHEKSVSFHIAQTSNNAVVQSYAKQPFKDEFYQNAVAVSPNLGDLQEMLKHDKYYTTCIGKNGVIESCGNNPTMDAGGSGGVMVGKTNAYYRGCSGGSNMCLGTSVNSGAGCHFYELDGSGIIDIEGNHTADSGETLTEINQWTHSVEACDS